MGDDTAKQPSTTPLIVRAGQTLMDFSTAMRRVIDGQMVKMLSWENGDYVLLKDEYLMIYREENKRFHNFLVREPDMIATDWVIVEKLN